MMPDVDGLTALKMIREKEYLLGIGGLGRVKIIMTTCLDETKTVLGAFREGCDDLVP